MEIKIPKLSEFVGKQYIFLEDFTYNGYLHPEGLRFKITKIKGDYVTIKITSPIKDCDRIIDLYIARQVRDVKSTIKELDKVIKIWEEDEDKFYVDKKSVWNKPRDGKRAGHCINTGYYDIPHDHPDLYGMATRTPSRFKQDSIMTLDYAHKDGKNNIYSYQRGRNSWYSKACYEFMRLGDLPELEKWESNSLALRNEVYRRLVETTEMTINTLNKARFARWN